MRALNYHHLRYFHAVARSGNLTRTANDLNVSQSALSAQIRKLEDQLGHKLFERQGRSLVLTEAGHIALAYADDIFGAGDALAATMTELEPRQGRVLRVGALATLSRNFQVAFLKPLIGRKDVNIHVRSGRLRELVHALESYELDVILTNQPPEPGASERLLRHQVARQPVGLISTPDRVQPGDIAETLLSREPVLVPSSETSMRADFDAYCAQRHIVPRIVAEVDDMAMLRVMARQGQALAVVPAIVVKDELDLGELTLAAELPGIFEAFYALSLRRRFPNTLVELLLAPVSGARRMSALGCRKPIARFNSLRALFGPTRPPGMQRRQNPVRTHNSGPTPADQPRPSTKAPFDELRRITGIPDLRCCVLPRRILEDLPSVKRVARLYRSNTGRNLLR